MKTASLGSAADLARTLGRSRQGVKNALTRANIKPIQNVGGIDLYDMTEAAPLLAGNMRARNKQAQP